jgi:hypothetical protein
MQVLAMSIAQLCCFAEEVIDVTIRDFEQDRRCLPPWRLRQIAGESVPREEQRYGWEEDLDTLSRLAQAAKEEAVRKGISPREAEECVDAVRNLTQTLLTWVPSWCKLGGSRPAPAPPPRQLDARRLDGIQFPPAPPPPTLTDDRLEQPPPTLTGDRLERHGIVRLAPPGTASGLELWGGREVIRRDDEVQLREMVNFCRTAIGRLRLLEHFRAFPDSAAGGGLADPWEGDDWDALEPLVRRLLKHMHGMERADLRELCPAVWGNEYSEVSSSAISTCVSKANCFLRKRQSRRKLSKIRTEPYLRWE